MNCLNLTGVIVAIAGLAVAQPISEIENPKVDRVAEKMNCTCGCQLNMACKMEPWPCQTCRKAKIKIAEMQQQGKSDQQILDQFASQMGPDVIAIRPGIFGTALSYSAAAIGLILVMFAIRRYRRPRVVPLPEVDPKVLARIEKDMAKLD
jgi:cytochrome c-type biogenesis protein CcmH/NrfF